MSSHSRSHLGSRIVRSFCVLSVTALFYMSASASSSGAQAGQGPSAACVNIVKNYSRHVVGQHHANCPIADKVALWLQLKDGSYNGTFEEISTIFHHFSWPNSSKLLANLESLITDDTPDAHVLAWFAKREPLSGAGAVAYLNVLQRKGDSQSVKKLAPLYWVKLNFSDHDEAVFLEKFSHLLNQNLHWKRVDRLLWDERVDSALYLIPKLSANHRALAHARIALIRDQPGVEGALARVPAVLKNNEGLWYNRTKWRRMRHLDNMDEYLIKFPSFTTEHAELWGKERHAIARNLLDQQKYKAAYTIAAHHQLNQGPTFADVEWLAGWIALTFRNSPEKALQHFSNFYKNVVTPLSKGRAAFWAARAEHARNHNNNANEWLKKAAQYPAHFYGQLALEQLHGNQFPPIVQKIHISPEDQNAYHQTHFEAVIHLLAKANFDKELKEFLEHAADTLPNLGQKYAFIKFLDRQYPRFVVLAAKRIARQTNFIVPEAYPTISEAVSGEPTIDPALTLGIIRQESHFDPLATSPAGAMGLMQLMTSTAKEVARKIGIKFSKNDLHAKPTYNIRLGQHYFKRLLHAYNNSSVITLAAYNAGPGNLRNWLSQLGDPRKPSIDIVNWIESIPFPETRTYIHRVLENYVIYSEILEQKHHASHKPAHRFLHKK